MSLVATGSQRPSIIRDSEPSSLAPSSDYMEIRTFAETVLFSPDLADKLRRPDTLSDTRPGRPIPTVMQPARVAEHQLRRVDSRHQSHFPSSGELRSEHGRLDAMHFFANHELTALELMAMALLKFTDAPTAWRRSVAVTMRDEQDHARLYLNQLRSRGRAFGELPINDHFWRIGVGMTSPQMYAAVVGMTLEQANLDFADHYGRMFRALGDDDAADVLDRVLVDEIRHVRHGVFFLNAWKDPEEDLWDAWTRALPAPLTPARAKGPGFVLGPRREAGLPEAFISRLRTYSYSKGRPPRVHAFDATDEGLADFSAATVHLSSADVRADLNNVMLPLCKRDDVLIAQRKPNEAWWLELENQGFQLPQVVVADAADTLATALVNRTLGRLVPWQWTSHLTNLFAPIEHQVVNTSRQGASGTGDARGVNTQRLASAFDVATPSFELPGTVSSVTDDRAALHLTGLLRIDAADSVQVLGQTQVLRNADWQREATVVGKRHLWLSQTVRRFVHGDNRGPSRVARRMEAATRFVGERLAEQGVRGFAAVDGVVLRSAAGGRHNFRPIAIVHQQLTPEHVALALRHNVAAASSAVWCVLGSAAVSHTGLADLPTLVSHLCLRLPTEATTSRGKPDSEDSSPGMNQTAKPRLQVGQQLRQGVVKLSDPTVAAGCVAVVLIARKPSTLQALLIDVGVLET